MKVGCPESMKFKRTARRLRPLLGSALGLVDVSTVLAGLLERLWQATAKDAPRGDIGRFTDDEIAEAVGWLGDAASLLAVLIDEGWLDRSSTHRLLVHDWPDHAPNWVRGNIKHKGGWATPAVDPNGGPDSGPMGDPKDGPRDGPKDSGAMGERATPPSQAKPTHSKPSPSSSAAIAAEWSEVEEELIREELATAPELLRSAREHGCSPLDVRRVLAHWRNASPAWELGGLAKRLGNLRPNQDPATENLWPPRSKRAAAAENSARREAVAAAARDRREADDDAKQLARREADRLEEAHGTQLDEILAGPLDEIKRLFAAAFATPNAARLAMRNLPRGVRGTPARVELLIPLDRGAFKRPARRLAMGVG
jgi:hypothetical protein